MRRSLRIAAALAVAILAAPVPPARAAVSDAWITAKTKIALATTEGVPSNDVDVDTIDGRVTLHGTVPSEAAKAQAEKAARGVSGVREVRNLLQVVPSREERAVSASDAELRDRVAKALADDRSLADSGVKVQSVNDGVVLLAGKASTLSHHLRAVQLARAVPGVRKVASEVQSPDRIGDEEIRRERDAAEAGTRGLGDAATDAWITSATKIRLLADQRTPALDINVDTRSGVVTLFGIVPSEAAKAAAEEDAHKVGSVKRVMNRLQVVPSARREAVSARDDEVQQGVERALKQREELRDAKVGVEVRNGVARLTGSVATEGDRLAAAIAARSTPGVRSVEEDLRVTSVGDGK